MKIKFFETPKIQQLLQKYIIEMESLAVSNEFENERNHLIKNALDMFLKEPEQWDEKAAFNIKFIGEAISNELEDKLLSFYSLNLLFTSCFRIVIEPSTFTTMVNSPSDTIRKIKDFGIYRYNEFDERSKGQIDYALREMPIVIVREAFKDGDISTYNDFLKNVRSSRAFAREWEKYIENKTKQIDGIKTTLDGYESAFNFVGLYDGFNSLGNQKSSEILWSRFLLVALAIAIPCPLMIEVVLTIKGVIGTTLIDKLVSFIPLFSLTFILIYYFRVALTNHTSLKAQALQIDLRKSLCQFIQSYADYSKKIKESNPNSLAKFEEVIFSNIMPNQEKIPSTFDGIEQIATLISAVKPK
ncbi:hypothetical protein [Enterobacter sichuanensis]|uniref:hypothetical protein n=1 Tax=Enterobacter sichuanensis TaxID=2071710 RepID=UPI0012A8766D|nr:hypothetical protein [Enterobacter sichuanensis]QFQ10777.1 hypothetical protein C1N69_19670 [Enterobacter sichuanensis]